MPLPSGQNKGLPSRLPPSRPNKPTPNPEEDFVRVDPNKIDPNYNQTINEYSIEQDEPNPQLLPDRKKVISKEDYLPSPVDEDRFIDKKNKKIIPIGGDKSIGNVKNLDARKNALIGLKIARFLVYMFILAVFGLGIKNTYFPEQIYTRKELDEIVKASMGQNGYPLETGRAIAQEYLYYYMNADTTNSTRQVLEQFKTGDATKNTPSDNAQRPLLQPMLIKESSPLPYIGRYEFSVFLSDVSGSVSDSDGNFAGQWKTFEIQVYYDEKNNEFSIPPNSPTLISSYSIDVNKFGTQSPEYLPNRLDKSIEFTQVSNNELLNTAIEGFIKGYAESSYSDSSAIEQYLNDNSEIVLKNGFDKQVEATNVNYKIFQLTNRDNEYKIDIYVDWKDVKASNKSISTTYTGRYIMTAVEKGGKYYITQFIPYVYTDPID